MAILGGDTLKIIAHVNGTPIEQLTKDQKEDFERYVIKCIENRGYKLHKKSVKK